jgi:SOS-response transcriptional repressor LexA
MNMDEKPKLIRPTKKQRELLTFIEQFITEHGYSPSYREIMGPLNYTSVATVSLHVSNLIKRGHLRKRDHAARSLEVVHQSEEKPLPTNQVTAAQEKWLIEKIDYLFKQAEQSGFLDSSQVDSLYVLVGALKVLGLEGAAQSFMPRLSNIKKGII